MIVEHEDKKYFYELKAVSLENHEKKSNCLDRLMSNNYTEFEISSILLGLGYYKFTIEFKNRKYLIKFKEINV